MHSFRAEEVQGLVRYIYTGQVSAPTSEGSSWKKIIDDFKVGAQPEEESDCLDERNTKEQPLVVKSQTLTASRDSYKL